MRRIRFCLKKLALRNLSCSCCSQRSLFATNASQSLLSKAVESNCPWLLFVIWCLERRDTVDRSDAPLFVVQFCSLTSWCQTTKQTASYCFWLVIMAKQVNLCLSAKPLVNLRRRRHNAVGPMSPFWKRIIFPGVPPHFLIPVICGFSTVGTAKVTADISSHAVFD